MKKYIKTLIIFIILSLFTWIVYATVTIASIRKSSKLPWQWTVSWQYSSAHNVWTSDSPQNRFSCVFWTCNSILSNDWVVLDSVTWLYWQSGYPSSTYNWDDANSYCWNLVLWWYSDWRLPYIKEISSIFDFSNTNCSPNTWFFSYEYGMYWTAAPLLGSTTEFWTVLLYYSSFYSGNKNDTNFVHCVR